MCVELTNLGDQLVDHFVEAARRDGCSWAQIGSVLGVWRQGANSATAASCDDHGCGRGAEADPWWRASGLTRAAPSSRRDRGATDGDDHVDTEHLDLGILAARPDEAARRCSRAGLTWSEVETRSDRPSAEARADEGPLPVSAGAKKALELSLPQAISSGHRRIGTRHLLLALMRGDSGLASQLLARHGVGLDRVVAFVRERSSA